MGWMDKAKQALKGRSGTIEKGIDTAVDRLGTRGKSLRKPAEGLKARVRDLDEDRKRRPDTN